MTVLALNLLLYFLPQALAVPLVRLVGKPRLRRSPASVQTVSEDAGRVRRCWEDTCPPLRRRFAETGGLGWD